MQGDPDVDLLQFLALLDDVENPIAEKHDTAETQQALEKVRHFLGCDVVTENEFLDVRRAIEVLTSANHISQADAYEIDAYLDAMEFSIHPFLKALKETETGDTLMKDYEEIHHSQDLVQLQGLRTSLAAENQRVLELKKQLAEAEERVQATSAAIRSIISPTKLAKYSSLSASVKSYTRKKDMLKRQIDQGKQDLERVKKFLQSSLHVGP